MQYGYIKEILENHGLKLKHYQSTESTMDTIKELIDYQNDCYFVISDCQMKGKGRRGNIWQSPKGNVYISFNLNMQKDMSNYFIYNIATSISISKMLDNICNVKSKIKWPNDIKINGKKISGIMTEVLKLDDKNHIIIGFGINVESSPKINEYPTTYTKEINPKSDIKNIISLFIKYFFNYYSKIQDYDYELILNEYKNKLLYLNENINLQIDDSVIVNGKFEDINLDGSMKINKNGSVQNVYSARILNDRN